MEFYEDGKKINTEIYRFGEVKDSLVNHLGQPKQFILIGGLGA